jgi:hypothetical protein
VRYYSRPELLLIDEFGLDRIERSECPQAMALLHRLVQGAIILKIKGKSYRAHGPQAGEKPT